MVGNRGSHRSGIVNNYELSSILHLRVRRLLALWIWQLSRDSIPQSYKHSSFELPPVSQLLHSTLDIALPLRAPYGPTTFNKNPGVLTAFCLVIRRADRDLRLYVQHLFSYCWDRSAGQVESAPQSVRGVMMI